MNSKLRRNIFYFIMLFGIVIFFILGFVTHGQSIMGVLQRGENDAFMDLFNSMQYGYKPYEKGVIYPPLANLFYLILSWFFPPKYFKKGTVFVRNSHMGQVMICLSLTITVLMFMYIVLKNKKGTLNEKYLFGFIMSLSMPFLFMLERGNIIFICFACICAFLNNYRSENVIKRHLAYLALAIAVGIKIYPVFFGFLLLREKRWKDTFICVGYGIVIFFLPCMLFGGIQSIPLMINNIIDCTQTMGESGLGYKVSLANTGRYLGELIYQDSSRFDAVSLILKGVCAIGGTLLMILAKYREEWKLYMIPSLMMILLPDFSFIYSLIFLLVPLWSFLDKEDMAGKVIDTLYLILFLLIFYPIPYLDTKLLADFERDVYPLTYGTILESLSCVLFMVLLWREGFSSILQNKKNVI